MPMRKALRKARPRACGSGTYPNLSMTAWMRARVASCTSGDWLMTRDTVFFETLASRAMSLIVALRPGLMPETFTGAGTLGGATRVPAGFFRVRVMGRGFYGSAGAQGMFQRGIVS